MSEMWDSQVEQDEDSAFTMNKPKPIERGLKKWIQWVAKTYLEFFQKYRFIFMLIFSASLMILVLVQANRIFAVKRLIADLIWLQRSSYSRDIANLQVDLPTKLSPKPGQTNGDQILLAQKWCGILEEDIEGFSDLSNEELQYYQEKYNIIDYQQRALCLVVHNFHKTSPAQISRTIKSLLMQNYLNFHIVYLHPEPSEDPDNQLLKLLAEGNLRKSSKMREKKKRLEYWQQHEIINIDKTLTQVQNIFFSSQANCLKEDIIIYIEGQNHLIGKEVLKVFNAFYQQKSYVFAFSNYLQPNNKVGQFDSLNLKNQSLAKFIEKNEADVPLFAMRASILSDIIDQFNENRMMYTQTGANVGLQFILPILDYIENIVIYIPDINYQINRGQTAQVTNPKIGGTF